MSYFQNWWQARTPKEKQWLQILAYAFVIFLILFIIKNVYSVNQSLASDIERAQKRLRTYQKTIARKQGVQKYSALLKASLDGINAGLLPGEKPELSIAELQKILKQLGSRLDLTFQKITPEDPKESKMYSRISLGFPLSCQITELESFLIDLARYERLLQVTEFRLRVISRRNYKMTVHMVVSGFIENKKEKEDNNEHSKRSSEGGI